MARRVPWSGGGWFWIAPPTDGLAWAASGTVGDGTLIIARVWCSSQMGLRCVAARRGDDAACHLDAYLPDCAHEASAREGVRHHASLTGVIHTRRADSQGHAPTASTYFLRLACSSVGDSSTAVT